MNKANKNKPEPIQAHSEVTVGQTSPTDAVLSNLKQPFIEVIQRLEIVRLEQAQKLPEVLQYEPTSALDIAATEIESFKDVDGRTMKVVLHDGRLTKQAVNK